MFTHAFTIPANSTPVYLQASGTYIRYVAAALSTSNPKVRVKTDTQYEVELLPGQAVKLPRAAKQFKLTNVDQLSVITGTMTIGEGDMTDGRVSGEVAMFDGTYLRSLRVEEFFAPVVVGAVAAQYGHAQLWNPVGSNRLVICHRVRPQLEAAGTSKMRISNYNAALAGPTLPQAKYIAASPSGVLADIRTGSNAAPLGTPLLYDVMTFNGRVIEFAAPIVIPPGQGIFVICETLNLAFSNTFEYYHVPQ